MIRKLIPLMLVVVLALAGCGSKSSSSSSASAAGGNSGAAASTPAQTTGTTHFAKTKFVFHAGLAFGVFHRFLYKPFRAGDFAHPTQHKLEVVKAALAGAFVVHEVRLALHDAQSSKVLSKVVLPLTAMAGAVTAARAAILHHQQPASLASANSDAATASADSKASGQPIAETTAGYAG